MTVNFKIEEFYAVEWDGRHVDLHNNFNLASHHSTADGYSVEFVRGSGSWIKNDEVESLRFEFNDVTYTKVIDGDSRLQADSSMLSEITFFPSSSRDINDELIDKATPQPGDDLIFTFGDGKVLRIGARECKLGTKENDTHNTGYTPTPANRQA